MDILLYIFEYNVDLVIRLSYFIFVKQKCMKQTETKITELNYPMKEKLTYFPLKETEIHQAL